MIDEENYYIPTIGRIKKNLILPDPQGYVWNISSTSDRFYDDIIEKSIYTGEPGVYKSARYGILLRLMWMSPRDYIENQVRIMRFDNPEVRKKFAGYVYEGTDRGVGFDDPFGLFLDSAAKTTLETIKAKMRGKSVAFPCGIIVYTRDGTLSQYQEGRHRSIAALHLGVNKMPVWVIKFYR